MRIAFVLPGLNRVTRGAEVAFKSIAYELAQCKDVKVTLFGSGEAEKESPYDFISLPSMSRESFGNWPKKIPIFRDEYVYEEASFLLNFTRYYDPKEFDVTVTCCYPFINWYLRFRGGSKRPAHVFVTQNGDHPALVNKSEYAFFGCDGLVCTNPEYFERHKETWSSALIPNGVDPNLFAPGPQNRAKFDLPEDVPLVLMTSALVPYKRVLEGIRAVSQLEGVHLVICGDGPEREQVLALGEELMSGRFYLMKLTNDKMPDIYRAADVFLHMSLYEPFGNVYIEAFATGLPVIAHKNQVTQWICAENEFLIDTENELEVLKGLRKALNVGGNVIEHRNQVKDRFAWENIAKQYLDFFKTII